MFKAAIRGKSKGLLDPRNGKYNAAIMKTLISIVCFTVISWATAAAQDPVKVAPGNYRVLLNNAHVRVLDFTLKPGQKIPMAARPMLTGSNGKTTTMTRKAGEAWWRGAESLAVENTGKTEIHNLIVELKK
ncbi:MAG: hypothetical protein DMF47_10800 [Verrucomicrobia bacterium]|nr:MAG: hypothetical protein DMF47_10800 [Verrucomicrobiota bacterium]